MYSIPFETLSNARLQVFQYKINLRFLHINERKLSETEMYTFCFESKETMTHILFYFCTHVHLLWLQFAQCLKTKCGIIIDVTLETCILVMLSGDHFNIIDTCIIIKNTLYLPVNYKIQQQFSRNVWNRLSIIRN